MMNTQRRQYRLLALGLVLLNFTALGALRELEPGVYMEDFSGGAADVFGPNGIRPNDRDFKHRTGLPKRLKIVKRGGRSELYVAGGFHSRVFYQTHAFRDFVLELTIEKTKGTYAGVVVRDHWRIYLQMAGYLCVTSDLPQFGNRLLFKSGKAFSGPHDLKVICAGPLLHVYMDSERLFSYEMPEDKRAPQEDPADIIDADFDDLDEGRLPSPLSAQIAPTVDRNKLGFYSHHGEAYYGDLRIKTRVQPASYVMVSPSSATDGLLFSPESQVTLEFAVNNYIATPQRVSLSAVVHDWHGQNVSKMCEQSVDVQQQTNLQLPMGYLRKGFYGVSYTVKVDEETVAVVPDLPLAVQKPGSGEFSPPIIPLAAYSKYFNNTTPIYYNTYAHAIARKLADHGFNAIVADSMFTKAGIDIYQSYGIATIARSGKLGGHPAVIAVLASDEPKPEDIADLRNKYEAWTKENARPITTCMVGEGIGLGSDHDATRLWPQLGAQLRTFRWYGFKKSHYGLLHPLEYKGLLPLPSLMRIVEASDEHDWWFVLPSFGALEHEGYYQNPSPGQLRGLMHMALANGCDGLLLWSLQSHGKWPALLAQQSLAPTDGKFNAAATVAALVNKHAVLLRGLRHGAFTVENSNPAETVALPRRAQNGETYVYVVNKNSFAPSETSIALRAAPSEAVDVFTGRILRGRSSDDRSTRFALMLEPGDAALLKVPVAATSPPAAPGASLGPEKAVHNRVVSATEHMRTAIFMARLSPSPIPSGDGIGLLGTGDPRSKWQPEARTRCFTWSGGIRARSAQGYLPLASALRLAEVADSRPYWTVYSTASAGAAELRAMLHLAFARGSRAVVSSHDLPQKTAAVIDQIADLLAPHLTVLATLRHGGLDVRCKEPRVVVIPRQDDHGKSFVYAVNTDGHHNVTTDLLLWEDTWTWSHARDLFNDTDLPVKPRDDEGYLSCELHLAPGQGLLIATDARGRQKSKK